MDILILMIRFRSQPFFQTFTMKTVGALKKVLLLTWLELTKADRTAIRLFILASIRLRPSRPWRRPLLIRSTTSSSLRRSLLIRSTTSSSLDKLEVLSSEPSIFCYTSTVTNRFKLNPVLTCISFI